MKQIIMILAILAAFNTRADIKPIKTQESDKLTQEYYENYKDEYGAWLNDAEIKQLAIDCQTMSEDEQPKCNI